jgi:hypothetical protein
VSSPIQRQYDPATRLWAVPLLLTGGREVTVVLDVGECDRFTALVGGYGTYHLPANDTVIAAMLYAVTGRDVLTDLLPDQPRT